MIWLIEILRQAITQIRVYALRSVLTSLGIVVAVSAVIAVSGVLSGLEETVNRELKKLGTENVMVKPNSYKAFSFMGLGLPTAPLTRREWSALNRHVDGISTVVATSEVSSRYDIGTDGIGQVRFGANAATLSVLAASDQLPLLYKQVLSDGRFLAQSDEDGHLRVCVISSHVIKLLGLPEPAIGQRIQVGNLMLSIVGVMPGNGDTHGAIQQIGDVYIPFSIAEELTKQVNELKFGFRVLNPEKHDLVLRNVSQTLRQSLGTPPSDVDDFVIEDAEQLRAANDEMVKLLSIVLVLLVSISLFVGGIGVMNVLLVSVFERTREIGILLALGATRNQIRLQFLIEAGIMSLFGAILGVIIGWVSSHLIVYLALPRVESAVVPLWTILSAIGVTICVGVLAGVFPAIRAANLDPIEALAAE